MIDRSDTLNQFCVVAQSLRPYSMAAHARQARGIHPVALTLCESATSTPPFAGEDGVEKHVLPQAVLPRVLAQTAFLSHADFLQAADRAHILG